LKKGTGETEMAAVRVASRSEIPAGSIKEFNVSGKAIAIANLGGKFHAISNACLHKGGPLGRGTLEGEVVTCPWHGWQFDVINGKAVQSPAMAVACYLVEVRGEEVFAELG
jgi:nitrite reductase (NADH) small subunit